jgi:hypothetical protein
MKYIKLDLRKIWFYENIPIIKKEILKKYREQ